ncbi:hypothetical protein OH807_40820 [Kitasatospora sp. NBC_01560]|uniref:hypothetical protein n=1 Tax=Kitasatospora sp. NBC_01560 TaxID=2975965 RepID=UPI00386A2AF7
MVLTTGSITEQALPGRSLTVRRRTKVTEGEGSRAAGLAMVFKPVESAAAVAA